jgi:hypothetical protein
VQTSEASNGYVAPSDLNSWFKSAGNAFGWNAGVMGWEWAETSILNNWIGTIYPNNTNVEY